MTDYYTHDVDEETEAWEYSQLPKITWLSHRRAETQTQVDHAYSSVAGAVA